MFINELVGFWNPTSALEINNVLLFVLEEHLLTVIAIETNIKYVFNVI